MVASGEGGAEVLVHVPLLELREFAAKRDIAELERLGGALSGEGRPVAARARNAVSAPTKTSSFAYLPDREKPNPTTMAFT